MSEYAYRQPVEVRIGADWLKAVYGYPEGGLHRVSFINTGTTSYWELAFAYRPDEIRPDPDFVLAPRDAAPQARSGWRLPEPGDVVRVLAPDNDAVQGELELAAYVPTSSWPFKVKGNNGLVYGFRKAELVRLHDVPEPAPTPEPLGTLDACRERADLVNAGLQYAIDVLNNPAPTPAQRDAAILILKDARLRLGEDA